MSRHIRFLALALAFLMLVPAALAGCSNNEEPTNSTVTTPSTNDATGPSSEPSGGAISAVTDDPDKIDLGGYEFVLSTTGYACLRSVFAEGETLSVEAEDLQEHYKEIEDTLNCVIIAQNMTSRCDCMDELLPSAIGGIKFADFICCRQSTWIPLAMMGGLRPLDSMIEAGLDLYNEENFYQTHTQMSEINGHIYACDLAGKYRTVRDDVSLGYFYAFNKELCENAGYPAEVLYQAVRDGEWTYEMMLEIARKISKDTDGDGAPDIWGLSLTGAGDEIWSNGAAPITYDKAQGKWISNVTDQRVVKALQFMSDISQPDILPPVSTGLGNRDRRMLFYEGHAGFATLWGANLGPNNLGRMDIPFGILPIPKGPDADHYSINLTIFDAFVCQSANQDWEKSAKVMNAIGAACTDTAAYKKVITDAFCGDEAAVEMLFDYALPYVTLNIASCSPDMDRIISDGMYDSVYHLEMTPAQAVETYNDKIQSELDNVFQQR